MEFKKNQIVELYIDDIGNEGEGIGHIDGYALFLKDAVIGDKVRAKIIKTKKNYGFARVEEVIEASKDRVSPRCSKARQCGGCTLQHLAYEKQLEYKFNKVKNCLERIGGLENIEEKMEPILGMEEPFYYRNKAQFPVGYDKEGNLITGFYAGRTHHIIDCTHCMIQHPVNEQILLKVLDYMKKNNITAYDEKTHKGLVRHIVTRVGFKTGEIMVCLVVNGSKKNLRNLEMLVDSLTEVEGMTSICVNINKEKTNRILGSKIEEVYGKPYIYDYIGNVKYQIGPLSFFQVNPTQTKVLYEKAMEYADLKGEETVWDLYCGIGTISLFLAQKAKKVYGVEIVKEAIDDARLNAKMNGFDNAEFFVGKAEEVLPREYEKNGVYADTIVVDPPRKGCDSKLLETMVKMAPKRIVYVSCDPATLARDLKVLSEQGYEVEKVCAVDQFSHSSHVETVVLLSQLKQKPDDYINVTIELDDMDITSAETKATYDEIKKYVAEHNAGMKVSNLYISQVKRKCGIEVGRNLRVATRRMDCLQGNSTTAATDLELVPSPNLPKNEDSRQPQCPEDKESAIVEALKHFKMNS